MYIYSNPEILQSMEGQLRCGMKQINKERLVVICRPCVLSQVVLMIQLSICVAGVHD
jgi:hypothetical protein